MVAESVIASLIAAGSAVVIACVNRSRCQFLVSKHDWSYGLAFSEVPLPSPPPPNSDSDDASDFTALKLAPKTNDSNGIRGEQSTSGNTRAV